MRSQFLKATAVALFLAGCGTDWDLDGAGGELYEQPQKVNPSLLCSAEKRAEILEDAESSGKLTVEVNCSFNLAPTDVVTKRLILTGSAASGTVINCNGAKIDHSKKGPGSINSGTDSIVIRSKRTSETCPNYSFDRPTDIMIKHCQIFGSIRVIGMAHNGQGRTSDGTHQAIKCSSQCLGHTARARAAAPTRITFYKIKVTAHHRTPLYLAPGVTHTALIKSELKGAAVAAALYLDAESAYNTFRDNHIHTKRKGIAKRELISVDGSSHNTFINNRFSELGFSGGIYLYRNCGEEGVIRHARPYYNQFVNNVFYYKSYKGTAPAVFLGAKEGFYNLSPHCSQDDGYDFGSSKDDADYVRYNVVMQNQFYDRYIFTMNPGGSFPGFSTRRATLADHIRQKGGKNSPNYVGYNEIVNTATQRLAGCHVGSGFLTDFILHGAEMEVFRNHKGEPVCRSYKVRCNDGALVKLPNPSCGMSIVHRGCKVTGDSRGCLVRAHCPSGKRVIAARAACNLEWGAISSSQLAQVPINRVRVVVPSDKVTNSQCRVHTTTLTSGEKTIKNLPAGGSVVLSCKEHDKNGGDCHVDSLLYCL